MTDVIKMYPSNAGENPDNVLEQAIGAYESVIVLGRDKEGMLDSRCSTNLSLAEVMLLLVQAQNFLSKYNEFTKE